ncbi:MAG: hypothetical protein LBV15_00040 [Planctomycetota bacterium]|jgi:hypothetical protein|nr:hypothetical protein [Planctomycetota bacterium]
MTERTFSRRALLSLAAASTVLFAVSLILRARGDGQTQSGTTAGPDSRSVSALGHAGFYDTLRRLGRPARRRHHPLSPPPGGDGVLILAEPDAEALPEKIRREIQAAPRLLLVLPKWRGRPDPPRPKWVAEKWLGPRQAAQEALELISGESRVFRREWPAGWSHNELPFSPSGTGVAQLIRPGGEIRPIVGGDEGVLVGEIAGENGLAWILSDPDPLANQGLLLGENAAFAVALADALRNGKAGETGGIIVFDETTRGVGRSGGSLFGRLFRFPGAAVTIIAAAAAAMLLLAGTGRFGAVVPARREIDFGKRKLLANGARLLDQAGHQAPVLGHYARMVMRSTAQALHAPPRLDEAGTAAWLDRIGRARGLTGSCRDFLGATGGAEPARLRALAAHRWKKEMLDAAASGGRAGRSHPFRGGEGRGGPGTGGGAVDRQPPLRRPRAS